MPRPPRLHVPGGCYHVILRGNHREALFASAGDRDRLNELFAEVLKRFDARIHAFCWMTNHLHALIQVAEQPLGRIMHRVAGRYSRLRHRALRTTGHLFERRYKAKLIDVDAYFLTLLRYIHLNPVKARIVADPADYPWSSHRAYLGLEEIPWLTSDFGLSLFGRDLERARNAYARFISDIGLSDIDDPDKNTHPEDCRIIGTDQFIQKLPFAPYKSKNTLNLDQLAQQYCESQRLSIDLLRSTSRARRLTRLRAHFASLAIERRVATLSEVARYLNRDSSALGRLLARHGHEHGR